MAGTLVSLLCEQHGEAMKMLVQSVADAVGAASCRIVLIDPQSKQLVVGAAISGRDEQDGDGGGGSGAPITVALNYQGHSLGMLTAESRPTVDPARFREDLDWISDIVAQTIQVLQELASERDNRVLLESFNEIARARVAKSDEPDALTTMLDQLWRVIRYDAGVVALLDGGILEVATARGAEPGQKVIVSDVIGLEAALSSRKPVALDSPSELLPAFGLPAVELGILAPLRTKEIVVGAFVLAFGSKAEVGDRQAKLLERFADHGRPLRRCRAPAPPGAGRPQSGCRHLPGLPDRRDEDGARRAHSDGRRPDARVFGRRSRHRVRGAREERDSDSDGRGGCRSGGSGAGSRAAAESGRRASGSSHSGPGPGAPRPQGGDQQRYALCEDGGAPPDSHGFRGTC